MHQRRAKIATLLLVPIFLPSSALADSKIRILLVGQVTPEHCPAPRWFGSEPLVDFTLVPTKLYWSMNLADAQRFIRLYFPRNRDDVQDYDFLMFVNPYFEPFTATQIENMRASIVEGGSGAFQTLGGLTIDWTNLNLPWLHSSLAPIFPNDPTATEIWENYKGWSNLPYTVEVNRDASLPPVLKMFIPHGIERVPGYWTIVLIVPQQGATIWGRAKGAFPGVFDEPPVWLLSWRFGKGMTWSVADDLDCPWWGSTYYPSEQKYAVDVLLNIALHSLGRPLPEDIVIVNSVRRSLEQYNMETATLNAYFTFVERFGVNFNQLLKDQMRIQGMIDGAKSSYVDGLYQEALDETQSALTALDDLEARTLELRNQALLWVYLIEWAFVTGTGMLAGYVLYLLMLRRKLYREVRVTRSTNV